MNASEIKSYIEDNCATATLQSVSERFNCHPNSLTRLLKKAFNSSFNQIAVRARAELAAKLLADGGTTVQQAAAACGYSNSTRFYQVFEQHFGVTPGEWRRSSLYRGQSASHTERNAFAAHDNGLCDTR